MTNIKICTLNKISTLNLHPLKIKYLPLAYMSRSNLLTTEYFHEKIIGAHQSNFDQWHIHITWTQIEPANDNLLCTDLQLYSHHKKIQFLLRFVIANLAFVFFHRACPLRHFVLFPYCFFFGRIFVLFGIPSLLNPPTKRRWLKLPAKQTLVSPITRSVVIRTEAA